MNDRSEYRIRLGRHLRSYREGRALAQRDVVRLVPHAIRRQATLSYYEAGLREVPLFVADELARLYGVRLDVLVALPFTAARAAGKVAKRWQIDGLPV